MVGASAVRVLISAVMVLATFSVIAPVATAQSFQEGPDYQFFYETYPEPTGTIRSDWNLYGGPQQLPYYIHTDVLDAGFGDAVKRAFATFENDAGSDISFVYSGETSVVSEIQLLSGSTCCGDPSDDFNVVSFGVVPAGSIGQGGFAGSFSIDSTGAPTGSGSGRFDLTLSIATTFSTDGRAGTTDVESLVLHELGHALGLDHPSTNSATAMWATNVQGTIRRSLHPADSAALAILYPAAPQDPNQQLCDGRAVTINMNTNGGNGQGTGANDVILGTPNDDVISGLGGDDRICGMDGRDRISGGPGVDRIFGGFGIDYISGDDGGDILDGEGGSDRMWGGVGNDLMLGDSGADRMFGGPGDDEMRGMGGQDFMWGEAGNDVMQGNFQTDNMWGGPGNDDMFGAGGKDSLFGEAGNDDLFGGNNTDYLHGGDGVDTANGGRGRDKPLVGPQTRASNGQLFGGSGCIAETTSNCQPVP